MNFLLGMLTGFCIYAVVGLLTTTSPATAKNNLACWRDVVYRTLGIPRS